MFRDLASPRNAVQKAEYIHQHEPARRRMSGRPKVLFIAGFFRSGSTILDRILGQIPNFVSAGELRFMWEESFLEDRPCGCGRPFSQCPFWNAVVQEAYGPDARQALGEVVDLKPRVDRMRHVPKLISPWKAARFRGELDLYGRRLEALYRAIRRVSGCGVIVDSSKDPSYAHVLANVAGIDLRIVHLVRDGRAVAHSWRRKKIKYEVAGGNEHMPLLSPFQSSAGWVRSNLLVETLRAVVPRFTLVRYEDLMSDPGATLDKILSLAGERGSPLPLVSGPALEAGENHIVAGNPNRFRRGRFELRPDMEWRRAMSCTDKHEVTALTWPLLRRYGYPGR